MSYEEAREDMAYRYHSAVDEESCEICGESPCTCMDADDDDGEDGVV